MNKSHLIGAVCSAVISIVTLPLHAATISVVPASDFIGPTICKTGFTPPQCEARPYDASQNIAYQGNGAVAAVASSTILGLGAIHASQYLNDGSYGNGSAWLPQSSGSSWIKLILAR